MREQNSEFLGKSVQLFSLCGGLSRGWSMAGVGCVVPTPGLGTFLNQGDKGCVLW